MDLDIEMGDMGEGIQEMHEKDIPLGDDILVPDEQEEPGEVVDEDQNGDNDASKTIVPTKVHIRGLDNLHTDEIKGYVKTHFGIVDKVEWIDDTSANLVFGSEASARDAIVALSAIEIADATALGVGETLPAKTIEGKPGISLQVRFAVQSDKKEVGAALRSRYYLLHPEHDPEEKRRRQQENRSRYRDRDGERNRDYRRNGARRRRDSDDEIETFEASMYDDAPRPEKDRRSPEPRDNSRSYVKENRGKELFIDRSAARDRVRRGRSASPRHDRDDEKDDDIQDIDVLASSSHNRTKARFIRDRLSSDNKFKELFPSKPSSGKGGRLDQLERAIGSAHLREEDMPKIVTIPDAAPGESLNIKGIARHHPGGDNGFSIKGAANARELFPSKLGEGNAGKELLDMNRSKRRQRAEDLFS